MDFEVPEDAVEMVQLARDFGRAELRHAEHEIDRFVDPVEAYTSDVHQTFRKQVRAIGFHQILLPEDCGGLGLSPLTYFLALEQLTTGGAGLGLVMQADLLGVGLAVRRRSAHPVYEEYVQAFLDDPDGVHSGAWAITEPDIGSDIYSRGASFGVRARPSPGGAGWVIDGAKSSWCSNGWLADMLCVMVNVDPGAGMDGTGIFLIPGAWPGVTRGRPVSKVGLRALNQCDVSFDGVEVPAEFLIVPPGPHYQKVLKTGFIAPGNTAVGFGALGVAQAAYELGLAYAAERHQGGKPIVEHQLVAKRLFDAYTAITASRLMLYQAAVGLAGGRPDMKAVYAARVQACRAAARVSADMMFLHGGNGITTEYPVEKLWRDSQPLQLADGTVDVVSLQGAQQLADEEGDRAS